jgi:hypothetical protein
VYDVIHGYRWIENTIRTVANIYLLSDPFLGRYYAGFNGIETCAFRVDSYDGIDATGGHLITSMIDPGYVHLNDVPPPAPTPSVPF